MNEADIQFLIDEKSFCIFSTLGGGHTFPSVHVVVLLIFFLYIFSNAFKH